MRTAERRAHRRVRVMIRVTRMAAEVEVARRRLADPMTPAEARVDRGVERLRKAHAKLVDKRGVLARAHVRHVGLRYAGTYDARLDRLERRTAGTMRRAERRHGWC